MINKLKNIVKGIRLNVKIARGVAADQIPSMCKLYKAEMISADGVIYDYSPASLAAHGVSLCGTSALQFTSGHTVQLIMYDDLYLELSENARQFLIQHEKGHFELQSIKNVRDINDEFDADTYAAKVVGKENALKALKEMSELLSTVSFSKRHASVVEMNSRIENLKLM